MPRKNKNRNVPVYGRDKWPSYFVSGQKAATLIKEGRASPETYGLQLRIGAGSSPVRIEAAALSQILQVDDEGIQSVVDFIRKRSPHQWKEQRSSRRRCGGIDQADVSRLGLFDHLHKLLLLKDQEEACQGK